MELVSVKRVAQTNVLTDIYRHCCTRSFDRSLHSLTSSYPTSVLRDLCYCARSDLDHISGNALLALQQLSHLLGLPVVHCRHMVIFLRGTLTLPELDESLAHVLPGG